MNKNYLFSLALIMMIRSMVHGQAPSIVPVAPEAAALAKEVNYPVSYNTGVANISLPLTQIQRGNLTLPIALNYHSGGFKTNERSGSVGLGFSLSCDLQITRTINGLDDLQTGSNPGYPFNPLMKPHTPRYRENDYPLCVPSMGESMAMHAYAIAERREDGMPDKFNYRLLNKSGTFVFKKEANGSYRIVTMPYDNTISITYHANGRDNGFTVIDSDGTTYYFEDYREEQVVPPGGNPFTSWKCKKIENSAKTESFQFTWVNKSPQVARNQPAMIVYLNELDICGSFQGYHSSKEIGPGVQYYEDIGADKFPLYSPKFIEYFGLYGPVIYHLPYLDDHNNVIDKTFLSRDFYYEYVPKTETTALVLSEISFRGGKVTFSGTDKLNSIVVKDASGNEVKSFLFTQSYTTPAALAQAKEDNGQGFEGTLYLDKIQVAKNGAVIEEYGFQYGQKFCFGAHLKGRDAWGYVNDYTTDLTSTQPYNPQSTIPHQKITQQVVTDNAGGGWGCSTVDNVTFTFGNSNNTELPSSRALVGLLSRIVYPTGGYVDFQYEPNKYNYGLSRGYTLKQGGGARIRSITHYDGQSSVAAHQKYYRYGDLEDGIGMIIRAPNNRLDLASQDYNGYSYSTLHTNTFESGAVMRTQRTTYEPASSQTYTYANGASIYYTKVTEYNSDFGVNTGKKVYTYYPPKEFIPRLDTRSKIEGTDVDVLHTEGLLGQQHFVKDFKYENGGYTLLHSKEYKYALRSLPDQVKVVYAYIKSTISGGWPNHLDCETDANMHFVNCDFRFSGERYLRKTCEAYQAGEYGLEIGNVLLTEEIETTIRNGNALTQTTKYFYDNNSYWQPSRIVTSNSQRQELTKTLKYCYDFSDDVHNAMRSKNMVSLPVEEIVYNNTLAREISRVKTTYGLIEISPSQSFIAPVQVQKSFGGAAWQTQLTYDQYDQHANILQVTGKDKLPITYLWGYNRLYPIAEIKGATYAQVAGAASATGFETLLSTHDGAQIAAGMNERRALFPSARITSFTYNPLVGIRSLTNPAGLPAYFEYDNGGRLQVVKDKNEDIVKTYDYNMLNSTVGMAGYPWYLANVPQMETFYYLCYHNVPVTRFPFNYVVEGGKHTGYIGTDPDFNATQEMQRATQNYTPPTLDCSEAGEKVLLSSRKVRNAHLDLLNDGSVVYSKPFPNTFVRPEDYYATVEFYVPVGQFKVNLRLEGSDYAGVVRLQLHDGVNNIDVKPGDSVDISAGKTYTFIIYIEGQ